MAKRETAKRVVVATEEDFERKLMQHAVTVEFASETDEKAYVAIDCGLIKQMRQTLADLFGANMNGVLYHQNEDWWPTKTRFLELDASALTIELVNRLQKLLDGPSADWRINVHAYCPLDSNPAVYGGSLNIYRDWILCDRQANELLERNA
jgi:hypothetical protein